jgi:hypothetical protein
VTDRPRLVLDPIAADPEIGRWLSAFEEVRRDTLEVVREIPESAIDRQDEISLDLFPYDDREGDGHLTPVMGETMAQHLERLSTTRELVLRELRAMSSEDYHRVHAREEIDVSADWVVFHLIDHEVEHRVGLSRLRDLLG